MMVIFCFICQGLTCQHENQCETLKPCHGNAQCRIDLFGRYSCNCSAGWTGQNCSIDIDECGVAASSGVPLCHHGATCSNTPGSFSCNCVPGYTGMCCLAIMPFVYNMISKGHSLHPVHTKIHAILKNSHSFFSREAV